MKLRLLLAALLLALVAGCQSLAYYTQAIGGHLKVLSLARPVEDWLADPQTDPLLRARLETAQRIRAFATQRLRLPDNASYASYAELGRSYVVWNVFAALEFSVRPQRWCFPFTGCVAYRGYFSREEAEQFAAGLAEQGHDVHVGGVPAYSTLGWFPDPVLNTFVHYPEAELARLIFHELSHQVVYAKDDTMFNESFAVAVERAGVRRWLAKTGDARQREAFERMQRIRGEFTGLIDKHRARLEALYRTRLAPQAMRERKQAILGELEAEYRVLQKGWGGFAGYDRWFARPPNNAQIASLAIYTRLVPAFEALLEREGGDLPRFYAAVKELAALPREERDDRLRAMAPSAARDR